MQTHWSEEMQCSDRQQQADETWSDAIVVRQVTQIAFAASSDVGQGTQTTELASLDHCLPCKTRWYYYYLIFSKKSGHFNIRLVMLLQRNKKSYQGQGQSDCWNSDPWMGDIQRSLGRRGGLRRHTSSIVFPQLHRNTLSIHPRRGRGEGPPPPPPPPTEWIKPIASQTHIKVSLFCQGHIKNLFLPVELDPMLLLVFVKLHKSPSQQAPDQPEAHAALDSHPLLKVSPAKQDIIILFFFFYIIFVNKVWLYIRLVIQ